jgi:hypothetical protein
VHPGTKSPQRIMANKVFKDKTQQIKIFMVKEFIMKKLFRV